MQLLDTVFQDINAIEKDISNQNLRKDTDECINKEELENLPDLKGGPNATFLFASNALNLV